MRALVGLDVKQVYVLDALRYSFWSEQQAYSRLIRQLRSIENRGGAPVPESAAVATLASAWQLIDTVHRTRGLFTQVRGLKHRSPEFKAFARATSTVAEFRNFFQHLNSEIPRLKGKAYPIMGLLSWVGRDSGSRTP